MRYINLHNILSLYNYSLGDTALHWASIKGHAHNVSLAAAERRYRQPEKHSK